MDDSEAYMYKKPSKTGSPVSSLDNLTSTYTELNIQKDERVTDTQTDGLDPTYSQLNFGGNELLIAKDEDPPIASRPGEMSVTAQADHLTSTYTELNIQEDERVTDTQTDGLDPNYSQLNFGGNEFPIAKDEDPPIVSRPGEMPVTAQAGPHKQEPNDNSGNRAYCKICLLFLVWAALFAIVVGLSIHVSQTGESKFTSDRNYYELNSTLQSKKAENSQLILSKKTCLKNLSALNSNLKRMHNDLRQQFSEMETKYRSVNETKAQICALMTSRRENACSQDWISNEEGCYFISTFNFSYDAAKNYCLNFDSKLLEINSAGEQNFIDKAVHDQGSQYWIGKCKGGEVASNVVYQMSGGCAECIRYSERKHCSQVHYRFICEKSAPLCPDISEKIQDLCQQPVGTT